MFTKIESFLISFANYLPLEVFSAIASFVEEIIMPIPSPAVMMITGSIAALQHRPVYSLIILALFGAIGKLFGAMIVYFFSDKIEDLLATRWGKFFGLNHSDIEKFGKRLGNGWKDYFILTILRALPIIPSSVLSVGCGILKVEYRLFLISTFIGTIVRDSIYIYAGYIGTTTATSFIRQSSSIESIIQALVGILIFTGLIFAYFRRSKI